MEKNLGHPFANSIRRWPPAPRRGWLPPPSGEDYDARGARCRDRATGILNSGFWILDFSTIADRLPTTPSAGAPALAPSHRALARCLDSRATPGGSA